MGSELTYKCKDVAEHALNLLMGRDTPFYDGIKILIMDLEGHYLLEQGRILSSAEQANLYIRSDVRIHSEESLLGFELGKQIFHFWAEIFHPDDYQKIVAEDEELEGNYMGIEKFRQELLKISKKEGSDG